MVKKASKPGSKAASKPVKATKPDDAAQYESGPPAAASVVAKHVAVADLWTTYKNNLSLQSFLIDSFCLFLLALGAYQLAVCVLVTNYPFNAFLGAFGLSVGQFVLLVCLRMQTCESRDFPTVSRDRAFAEFVAGSLLLHFTALHFVN